MGLLPYSFQHASCFGCLYLFCWSNHQNNCMENVEKTNLVSQQEAVQAVYDHTANLLLVQKMNAEEVKQNLVQNGLDRESASIIVDNLERQIVDAKKERARKDMLYGGLWCVGGIVVTAVTYSAASGGGSYVVAWGAILFGAIQFFRGLTANV